MNLKSVESNLECGKYDEDNNNDMFVRDLMLIFSNCKLYNGKDSNIWSWADVLEKETLRLISIRITRKDIDDEDIHTCPVCLSSLNSNIKSIVLCKSCDRTCHISCCSVKKTKKQYYLCKSCEKNMKKKNTKKSDDVTVEDTSHVHPAFSKDVAVIRSDTDSNNISLRSPVTQGYHVVKPTESYETKLAQLRRNLVSLRRWTRNDATPHNIEYRFSLLHFLIHDLASVETEKENINNVAMYRYNCVRKHQNAKIEIDQKREMMMEDEEEKEEELSTEFYDIMTSVSSLERANMYRRAVYRHTPSVPFQSPGLDKLIVTVHSLGIVSGFHSTTEIWPVGFKSSVQIRQKSYQSKILKSEDGICFQVECDGTVSDIYECRVFFVFSCSITHLNLPNCQTHTHRYSPQLPVQTKLGRTFIKVIQVLICSDSIIQLYVWQ